MTKAHFRYAVAVGLVFGAPSAMAKCRLQPEIRAKVTVLKCEAVTFAISDRDNPVSWPNKIAEKQVSGALINARVEESEVVWSRGATDSSQLWVAGSLRKLFIPATNQLPDALCPKTIPSTASVTTVAVCCDTEPTFGSVCIAPASVTPVLWAE